MCQASAKPVSPEKLPPAWDDARLCQLDPRWAVGSVWHIKHHIVIHRGAVKGFIWKEFHMDRMSLLSNPHIIVLGYFLTLKFPKFFLKASFSLPSRSQQNNEGDKRLERVLERRCRQVFSLECVPRRGGWGWASIPLHTHVWIRLCCSGMRRLGARFN